MCLVFPVCTYLDRAIIPWFSFSIFPSVMRFQDLQWHGQVLVILIIVSETRMSQKLAMEIMCLVFSVCTYLDGVIIPWLFFSVFLP